MVLSRFLVGAAMAASLLMSASTTAGAASLPPTLYGEALAEHTVWDDAATPACLFVGSFCVDGTAAGPYPGTFHEQGTYATVSTDPSSTPDEDYGNVTTYSVKF